MKTTLAEIAPGFDAFLIDQFGVLLDGVGAYPGAPDTLSELAAMGKQILLLSNSGKRAVANEARLTRLGFDPASYMTVLSSGEAAFAEIQSRIGKSIEPGAAVWLHSRDNDSSAIDGLDLRPVATPAEADLLIIAGSHGDQISLDDYRALLRPAGLRKCPAFCTNPDMSMLTAQGKTFGAGQIAKCYEDLGGVVDWVGKPFPLIYSVAKRMLGTPDPTRVLCIGDSPAHDIAGGVKAGFVTALVRTGLHADLSEEALMAHCQAVAMPQFILPSFSLSRPVCP